jgi:hypothetical protein
MDKMEHNSDSKTALVPVPLLQNLEPQLSESRRISLSLPRVCPSSFFPSDAASRLVLSLSLVAALCLSPSRTNSTRHCPLSLASAVKMASESDPSSSSPLDKGAPYFFPPLRLQRRAFCLDVLRREGTRSVSLFFLPFSLVSRSLALFSLRIFDPSFFLCLR